MIYCFALWFLLGAGTGFPQQQEDTIDATATADAATAAADAATATTVDTATVSSSTFQWQEPLDWDDVLLSSCWFFTNSAFHGETCNRCFRKAGSPLEVANLPKFNQCVDKFFLYTSEACQDEIGNMTLARDTQLAALNCFQWAMDYAARYWCLKKSNSTDIVERISVGVECALDVQERSEDALVLEKQEQNAAVQLKEKQTLVDLVPMLSMANCKNYSSSHACEKCFMNAVASGERADVAPCSQRYLLPLYQDCQPGIDSLPQKNDVAGSKDKEEEVVRCLKSKLIRHAVSVCVQPEMTAVNATTFRDSLICTLGVTMGWNDLFTGNEVTWELKKCAKLHVNGFLAGAYNLLECGIRYSWQWIRSILADR